LTQNPTNELPGKQEVSVTLYLLQVCVFYGQNNNSGVQEDSGILAVEISKIIRRSHLLAYRFIEVTTLL
jgi:hypothetical protein